MSLHCVNQVGLGEGGESPLSPEHSGWNLLSLERPTSLGLCCVRHTLGQDSLLLGRVYLENMGIQAFLGCLSEYPTLDHCLSLCLCQAAPSCSASTFHAGTEWGKGGLRDDVTVV